MTSLVQLHFRSMVHLFQKKKCQLFGDVKGKKVLEIGCGTGHSLQYIGERKASELWGIDISIEQIEKAEHHLAARDISAKLICSPMEEECGIPEDYFDFVYSVYGIGWTTDLDGTFYRIASYLKKKMVCLFSVGLIPFTNVLHLKMICLYSRKIISMNLGIQYLLMEVCYHYQIANYQLM